MDPFAQVYQWREDFPMLKKTMHGKPLVYLDSAATAQKPLCVIEAITDFYQNHYATVHRAVYDLALHSTHAYNRAREKIRLFLNANSTEEIIFTRGTTNGINIIAQSFTKAFLKPGDVIAIPCIEHHSNFVPWQMVANEFGLKVKLLPINSKGELILEEAFRIIDESVKFVSIAHISNVLGTLHPVKEIIDHAHKVGAKVLMDAAQSAPHLPLDVQQLDADFLAFSGHKIYGPTGIGVLFGKKELLEKMPPIEGGGDMIERVSLSQTTYNHLPYKFEAGTPMIAEVIALGAAIDYVNQIGLKSISEWENNLLTYATEELQAISEVTIHGTAARKGALISFTVKDVHSLDVGSLLDTKGVAIRTGHHCSQPTLELLKVPSLARISFGLYNTMEEVDYFIDSLKDVIKMLS